MTTSVRKAVIPAAGLGTRFLPATKAQPKEMLPLVDKPAIQYVVEEAVRAGITDILVITGRGKDAIEDHFDHSLELEHELERTGKHDLLKQVQAIADLADVHYIRQGEPLGLGHAVLRARQHVGGEPFAVLLPDDVMDETSHVLEDMIALNARTAQSVIAVRSVPPSDISAYGCIRPGPDSGDGLLRIEGIVEKPDPADAPSDLAVMGRYVLTPEIFEVLERVQPGKGGEIQLTDGIAALLKQQEVYGLVFSEGRWDIGNKLDFLRATVELGLARDDIGPAFRSFIDDVAKRPHS